MGKDSDRIQMFGTQRKGASWRLLRARATYITATVF